MNNMKLCIFYLSLVFLLSSCAYSPQVKLDKNPNISYEKHIFLQMNADPDMLAFDIRMLLEDNGFQVDDSTSETKKGEMVFTDKTITTYDRVTDSKAKLVLLVSYSKGGYPYRYIWRARLIDKTAKKTIGKYSYEWNAGNAINFRMSPEKIIKDMYSQLIEPFFTPN